MQISHKLADLFQYCTARLKSVYQLQQTSQSSKLFILFSWKGISI